MIALVSQGLKLVLVVCTLGIKGHMWGMNVILTIPMIRGGNRPSLGFIIYTVKQQGLVEIIGSSIKNLLDEFMKFIHVQEWRILGRKDICDEFE